MNERREFMKASLAALTGAATLVQANPTKLLGGEPATKDQAFKAIAAKASGPVPLSNDYTELDEEIGELMAYQHRLERAGRSTEITANMHKAQGISIPFATIPLNVYVRLSVRHLEVSAPKIPKLHAMMEWGGVHVIAEACNTIAVRQQPTPRQLKIVSKEVLYATAANDEKFRPHRVVSPKYVIDVDEPCYSMRVTANIILDMVEGIWAEYRSMLDMCEARVKDLPGNKGIVNYQATPIQVSIERRAYMQEVFAWSLCGGYVQ